MELALYLRANGITLTDDRKEREIFNYFAFFYTIKNNQAGKGIINIIKRNQTLKIKF